VLQREFTNFEHRRLENIDQYIINKNSWLNISIAPIKYES
jgi:hypothetical protein